jgi:hypothetical protein
VHKRPRVWILGVGVLLEKFRLLVLTTARTHKVPLGADCCVVLVHALVGREVALVVGNAQSALGARKPGDDGVNGTVVRHEVTKVYQRSPLATLPISAPLLKAEELPLGHRLVHIDHRRDQGAVPLP